MMVVVVVVVVTVVVSPVMGVAAAHKAVVVGVAAWLLPSGPVFDIDDDNVPSAARGLVELEPIHAFVVAMTINNIGMQETIGLHPFWLGEFL